jgi:membrane protein YdbS with pleckstrin-like domain
MAHCVRGVASTVAPVPLPRKFLNHDEELLVELRPHWVFFIKPLLVAAVAVAGLAALLISFPKMPSLGSDALLAVAAIPVLWLVGRLFRWRNYTLALTTTRVVLRRGVLDRDIVQLRLQRITEINLSQKLWERAVGTGRLIVDVQGEDDAVVLEFVRKPAIVQRVINGQINELITGGGAEPIPDELRSSRDRRPAPEPWRPQPRSNDTPPFGSPAVAEEPDLGPPAEPRPSSAGAQASHADIRDRLIELDDLRQRGIISDEEFAAKKTELLSRL